MKTKFGLLFTVSLLTSSINTALAADSISEMFTEGSVDGELKVYSYSFDTDGKPKQSDTAFGAILSAKTASFNGISFGSTFANASPIFNDEDEAGNNMLQDLGDGQHHEGYNKMLEYYVRGEWYDTTITYGAQEIYTPLMWHDYCQLLPKTYRGLTVINRSIENLELHAYVINDFSGWHDSGYGDMSLALSSNDEARNTPMYIAGARYNLPTDNLGFQTKAEAWGYHMEDLLNMSYFRVKLSKQFGDTNVFFMPSYSGQQDTGKKLADAPIDTYQYGFETGVHFKDFYVEAQYSKTGDTDFLGPWGFGRIIMQSYHTSFAAEETAYGIKAGYDFSNVGIQGLSAMVWWADYDRPIKDTIFPAANTEVDYEVKYQFTDQFNGALDGLSLSYVLADVDWTDMNAGSIDSRFRINYKFKIGN